MQVHWLSSSISELQSFPREWGEVRRWSFQESQCLPSNPDALVVLDLSDQSAAEGKRLIEFLEGVPVLVYDSRAELAAFNWTSAGASFVAASFAELGACLLNLDRIPDAASGRRVLLGRSQVLRSVAADIEMVAGRRCNVLIEGETGTGKEVVARMIHSSGDRRRGPWVAVNCGAIPEALLEAELFGYARGAFTGAVQARAGKFEAANHGTLFLDEIGDMPLAIQAKLLRVLQEREVERLGGNETVKVDVRILAATNLDLIAKVENGSFRQDLYYRLNVFRIMLPTLRTRSEDIPLLAQHFADRFCAVERLPRKILDPEAVARLSAHIWPGNVRELENAMESAVIISGSRRLIRASDLRILPAGSPSQAPSAAAVIELPPQGLDYQTALEEFEKSLLTQALLRTRGNKTAAAEMLGLKRTTLAAKMRVLEGRLPRLVA